MISVVLLFFFNDSATTEIYTLSLHGALPIYTSSLADWPQQARMLRLVTGDDGSRALETWMVDHTGSVTAFEQAGFGRQLAFDRKSTRLNFSHANNSYAALRFNKKSYSMSHLS